MSKLQELIKELCPDGVEFMRMDEVFEMRNGYTPSKANDKYWDNGTIPWFRMEDIRQNGRILSDSIQHITKEAVKGGRLFPANSFIIATTATIGEHALVIADSLANQRFTNLTIRKSLVEQILVKYLFYYLFVVGEWCKNNTNISGFASVDMSKFKKLEIPIPPLEVQNEIVRILNTFTSHAAELQAELQARKEQYEYYRNKLLTFDENDEGVKWMKLGEIGNICMCKRIMKHQTSDIGEVPFFKIGTFGKEADAFISYDLYDEYKNKYSFPRKGEILISASGTIGRTIIYDGQDAYFQDSNIIWIQNDESKVLNKYLYYYYQIIEWNVEGGTIKRLYNTNLSKTIIAYPSLSEQQCIVSILDKFESLVNDLSEGLPAEIAAVQEQYKYYRNKLLTFERKS